MKSTFKNQFEQAIIRLIIPIIITFCINTEGNSQTVIQVGASKTYTKIADAYSSISTPLSGPYIIELQSDYNVSNENQITLTAKSGASTINYILICPAINVSKTITGNSASGTFALNGADYIIIDGTYRGGTSSLTLANSSTSGITILINNNAIYNIIRNCTITGRNTSTSSGAIVFGTGTTGNGNNFNLITNNSISADGSYQPSNLIYSFGTVGGENRNNTISKNNFINFKNYGIYITSTGNGSNWTIGGNTSADGNNFYQTVTGTTEQISIFFKPGGSSSGNLIKYNNIGGSAVNCGGSAWVNNGTKPVVGIKANVLTAGYGATITYNTIKNFSLTNTSDQSYFFGIYADSGSMLIDHNTIGDDAVANSIQAAEKGFVCGIYSETTFDVDITNNIIANITMTNSYSTGEELRGIMHENMIGDAHAVITISGNTIHDLKSNGTQNINYDAVIYGIAYCDSSRVSVGEIYNNNIYNLNAYNSSGTNVYIGGIEADYIAFNLNIFNNKVHDILNSNANHPMIAGIISDIDQGYDTTRYINIYNNMIALNNNQNAQLFGIWDIGLYWSNTVSDQVSMNVYYNTVFLSGTISSGSEGSACYCRGYLSAGSGSFDTESNTILRNNIFINTRTGGTGKHLAIINCIYWDPAWDAQWPNRAKYGWGTNSSNYNFLVTSNSSAVCAWGTNNIQLFSFNGWKNMNNTDTSCSQDNDSWYLVSSSINVNNLFTNTSTCDLSINTGNIEAWYLKGLGVSGSQSGNISSDFFGNSRNTTFGFGTCLGAHEFTTSATAPTPTVTGTISVGQTQTFSLNGRTLGNITWNSGTGLPSSISFGYFGGTNPPGTLSGNYANCYWNITQTGGTDFNYNLSLYYDPALIGTISGESNIRLAKSDNSGPWLNYPTSVVNTTNKTLSYSGFTSFSNFTMNDANSPMPVELLSFTSNISNKNVILNWKTNRENNNKGFNVERTVVKSQYSEWENIGFVNGKGTVNTVTNYTFEDKNLQMGKYKYRLKQVDLNGNFEYLNLTNDVVIGSPDKFDVSQNYPNPFNPTTKINYQLPSNTFVTLKIYDVTGREIVTLLNEKQTEGYHTATFDAVKYGLSSGIYYCTLRALDNAKTIKMLLIK